MGLGWETVGTAHLKLRVCVTAHDCQVYKKVWVISEGPGMSHSSKASEGICIGELRFKTKEMSSQAWGDKVAS